MAQTSVCDVTRTPTSEGENHRLKSVPRVMDTLIKDLRYGMRGLVKQPGFTAVAVLSIALGIGVNVTIFSFVNAALFRPLPFSEPDRLARVWDSNAVSYPDYIAYRDGTTAFSGLAAYAQRPLSLTVNGQSSRVWSEFVSGNYFDVLKANPALGRPFLGEEDRLGANSVVVISNSLWRGSFNSDPSVIGKSLSLNQRPYTVVGVMPEKFVGATVISVPDLWLPLAMEPVANPGSRTLTSPADGWLMMLGRLRPDANIGAAQVEVKTIAARLLHARRERNSGPESPGGRTVAVVEARGLMIPPQGRTPALMVVGVLMAVVSLVLLVACANVANMLLARAVKRRKEIAVRLSLGAGRWRITRQMLTESLLLSIIGGGAGLFVALWGTTLLAALLPQSFSGNAITPDVTPDMRVFAYTLLLSLATGVIFGLLPALQSSKPDLVTALKDETIGLGVTRRRLTLRNLLVVTQIAVSVLLLVMAGLFSSNLGTTPVAGRGLSSRARLLPSFGLVVSPSTHARGKVFQQQLLERLRASAQVRSASYAETVPLSEGGSTSPLYVEGEATRIVSTQLLWYRTPQVLRSISRPWAFLWCVVVTLTIAIRRRALP